MKKSNKFMRALKVYIYVFLGLIAYLFVASLMPSELKGFMIFALIFFVVMCIAWGLKKSDNTRYIRYD